MAESVTHRPRVSVVIPTYNRPAELRRAIASVLRQSHQDFEIIVVDDASSIDPAATIDEFADERITLVRHETNRNAAAGRNTGASVAKGDYIALLDSDDEWFPHHLERRVSLMHRKHPDGIYGSALIEKNGNHIHLPPARQISHEDNMLDYLLSDSCRACTPSLFIAKHALLDIRFDELLYQHQDYDFNIRFHQKYRYLCDPEVTVLVHISTEDRMGTNIRHDACRRFIEKHRRSLSRETYQKYLHSILRTTLNAEGRSPNALRYLFLSMRSFPWTVYTLKSVHSVIPVLGFYTRVRSGDH